MKFAVINAPTFPSASYTGFFDSKEAAFDWIQREDANWGILVPNRVVIGAETSGELLDIYINIQRIAGSAR